MELLLNLFPYHLIMKAVALYELMLKYFDLSLYFKMWVHGIGIFCKSEYSFEVCGFHFISYL